MTDRGLVPIFIDGFSTDSVSADFGWCTVMFQQWAREGATHTKLL